MDDIFVFCPNICHRENARQRIFIVVGQYAGVLIVRLVNAFSHRLLIAGNGGFKKVFGILDGLHQGIPCGSLYGVVHFISHLLVRYETFLFITIVSQIAEMDQHGEYIVLAPYRPHIVTEFRCIDIHVFSREHTDDVVLQSVIIHLDVGNHRVVGTGCCPVAFAYATLQRFNH